MPVQLSLNDISLCHVEYIPYMYLKRLLLIKLQGMTIVRKNQVVISMKKTALLYCQLVATEGGVVNMGEVPGEWCVAYSGWVHSCTHFGCSYWAQLGLKKIRGHGKENMIYGVLEERSGGGNDYSVFSPYVNILFFSVGLNLFNIFFLFSFLIHFLNS